MAEDQQFLPVAEYRKPLYDLAGWAFEEINAARQAKLQEAIRQGKKFKSRIKIMTHVNVENRVRYCYQKPGRKGDKPVKRWGGYSREHPTTQGKRTLWGVYYRINSGRIHKRLVKYKKITPKLVDKWFERAIKVKDGYAD
jgi:hypothetical protein